MTHSKGERVACYWYDGRFTGTIKEVHGSKVLVLFDSGQQKWANPKQLRRLKPKKSKRREFWLSSIRKEILKDQYMIRISENKKAHDDTLFREVLPSTPKPGKRITREMLENTAYPVLKESGMSHNNAIVNIGLISRSLGFVEVKP